MGLWKINDSRDPHDREVSTWRTLWGWRHMRWHWFVGKSTKAKGWWALGTWRRELRVWKWTTRLKLAIGGEDNMVQFEAGLPLLFQFGIGFRVPRRLTDGWVHHRREFGLSLRGLRPDFVFAYDDDMSDMADYYRRTKPNCERCHRPSYCHPLETDFNAENTNPATDCEGYVPGWRPTRVERWPGWRLDLRFRAPVPYRVLHAFRRRFGPPHTRTHETIKVYEDVVVALPEGLYPGTVELWAERVRFRWRPWHNRTDFLGTFTTDNEVWMPFPGKGENSYDCGDDGFQGHTCKATTVAEVIASTVGSVMRQRERYGGVKWVPDGVGVMR